MLREPGSRHPDNTGPVTDPGWDAFVRQHTSRVFRLAYRLTGNRADAEDITQEVFVRALRSSPTEPRTQAGWFHRVTTNLFVDMLRRRGRVRSTSLDERPWAYESGDESTDPATVALSEVLDADLQAALDALPEAYREAVVLYDVQGYSYAEIATIVGAKPGTVRSRIHRGRGQLRAALSHRAPAPGRQRHGGVGEQPGRRFPPVVSSGTMSG